MILSCATGLKVKESALGKILVPYPVIVRFGFQIYKENSDLERIQLKFLRNMLGFRCQTATNAVLTDTGIFPLLIWQHSSALKYLDRLQKSTCPTLLRKCLTIQIELKEKGAPCWLKRLSNILESINYDHMNFDLNKSIASLFEKSNAKSQMGKKSKGTKVKWK